jgi:FMN phosphatase YigB (HAD superfamily)
MIAIAFALTGTLTIEDGLEREAFLHVLSSFAARLGRAFDERLARRLADELFPGGQAERDARPGALFDAVSTLFDDRLPLPVVVARFRQVAASRAGRAVRVTPETRTFLERIASLRVPSAILCNGWSAIAQRKAASTGFGGPVLVSEDIGAAKPSAHAFEALVRTIALPPDRIWYVGSDPMTDVEGATGAGLRAIWLNRDGLPPPAGLAAATRTIGSLDEILPELCEEYTRSLLGLRHVLRTALAWREGHFVPGVDSGLDDPAKLPPLL